MGKKNSGHGVNRFKKIPKGVSRRTSSTKIKEGDLPILVDGNLNLSQCKTALVVIPDFFCRSLDLMTEELRLRGIRAVFMVCMVSPYVRDEIRQGRFHICLRLTMEGNVVKDNELEDLRVHAKLDAVA